MIAPSAEEIPLGRLALALLPPAVVIWVLRRWGLGVGRSLHGMARMVGQLLMVGFLLVPIFGMDQFWGVAAVMAVMVGVAGVIALRATPGLGAGAYSRAVIAIGLGGGASLILVVVAVLRPDPWFAPRVWIPLAGMSFGNAMTAVSLAAERFHAEAAVIHREEARRRAYRAALIPITNALFAVGVVSLPGMMTGQILSGVSPWIAARYQILVMCLIFGSSGSAAALFLARPLNRVAP